LTYDYHVYLARRQIGPGLEEIVEFKRPGSQSSRWIGSPFGLVVGIPAIVVRKSLNYSSKHASWWFSICINLGQVATSSDVPHYILIDCEGLAYRSMHCRFIAGGKSSICLCKLACYCCTNS